MDIRLPDGTVLRGVPEGTTKIDIAQKLRAAGRQVPDSWFAAPAAQPEVVSTETAPSPDSEQPGFGSDLLQRAEHAAIVGAAQPAVELSKLASTALTEAPPEDAGFLSGAKRVGQGIADVGRSFVGSPNQPGKNISKALSGFSDIAGGTGEAVGGAARKGIELAESPASPIANVTRLIGAGMQAVTESHPFQATQDWLDTKDKEAVDALSPAVRASLTEDVLSRNKEGDVTGLGPALKDPWWWAGNVMDMAPQMISGVGAARGAARMGYVTAKNTVLARALAENVPHSIAAEAAEKAGLAAGRRAAIIAGGLTEGGVAAGQDAKQTEDAINQIDEHTMMNYPAYRALRDQGLSHEEARAKVATTQAMATALASFVVVGATGAPLNNWVAKWANLERPGMGRLRAAAEATALEGGQEAVQNPAEQIIQNKAEQPITGKGTYEGALEAAVAGLALGAVIGGAGGLAAGGHAKAKAEPTEQDKALQQRYSAYQEAQRALQQIERNAADPNVKVSYQDVVDARTARTEASAALAQSLLNSGRLDAEKQQTVASALQKMKEAGVKLPDETIKAPLDEARKPEAKEPAKVLNADEKTRLAQLDAVANAESVDEADLNQLASEGLVKVSTEGQPILLPAGRRQRKVFADRIATAEAAVAAEQQVAEKPQVAGQTQPAAKKVAGPTRPVLKQPKPTSAKAALKTIRGEAPTAAQLEKAETNVRVAAVGGKDLGIMAAAMERAGVTKATVAGQPVTVNTQPTEAQQESGNYQKGHVEVQGIPIAIENPKGTTRKGKGGVLQAHYGYVKGAIGADGEGVDVFVGSKPDAPDVFVIDQVNETGDFDEHKTMLGFPSQAAAIRAYRGSYEKPKRLGPITKMTVDEYKAWLKSANKKKPLNELGVARLKKAMSGQEPVAASVVDVESAKNVDKAKMKALRVKAAALAKKGDLTGPEAAQFKATMKQIDALAYKTATPTAAEHLAPAGDRMSTLSDEVYLAAHADMLRSKPAFMAIREAAHGVDFNADTAVDKIMQGDNPEITPEEFYSMFDATRTALRKQHGDTIHLYRAVGQQKDKHTTNWATTREFAAQFGGDVISKDIPIENVLAVNVTRNGKYHELIVGEPPVGAQESTAAAVKSTGASFETISKYLTEDELAGLRIDGMLKVTRLFGELPSDRNMAAAAIAGQAKRGWYERSAKAIETVFGPDAPRFAALLAALSPQTSVEQNFKNAIAVFAAWNKAGRPTERQAIVRVMQENLFPNENRVGNVGVLPAWIGNTVRALTAIDASKIILSGPKVDSFAANLRKETDRVTLDAWMAHFAAVDQTLFKGEMTKSGRAGLRPGYLAYTARVRQTAEYLTKLTGETWTPAEVQETVWSWAKAIYEKADTYGAMGSAAEVLQDNELTDELINATPDFASLFSDPTLTGQLADSGYREQLARLAAERNAGPARQAATAPAGAGKELRAAAKRLDLVRTRREQEAAAASVTPNVVADVGSATLANEGGFTLDPRTAMPQTSGWAFSPDKSTERVIDGLASAEDIEKFMADNAEALAQPGNFLGGWTSDGKSYLDVSNVTADRAEAEAAARAADQLAIFNLETGETVSIPKTLRFKRFSKATGPSAVFGAGLYGREIRGLEQKRGGEKVTSFYPENLPPEDTEEGLKGLTRYNVEIPQDQLYNANADPLGLAAQSRVTVGFMQTKEGKLSPSTDRFDFNTYERKIKEAGFKGYYMPNAQGILRGQARVFGEIKATREGEQAARATTEEQPLTQIGLTAEQARGVADRISAALNVPVNVVDTQLELPAEAASYALAGISVKGMFMADPTSDTGGEAYVVADANDSEAEAEETVLHEVVGHMGLRGLLGDSYNEVMDDIYRSFPVAHAMLARSYKRDVASNIRNRRYIAEEVVAHAAGKILQMRGATSELSIWAKIIAKVRDALRKIGLVEGYSRADLDALIYRSRDFVRRMRQQKIWKQWEYEGNVAAAVRSSETPAFKKWFAGSKVVDAAGAPQVLYHGTKHAFTEFNHEESAANAGGRFGGIEGGFWFTSNEIDAGNYGSKTIPAYLRVLNPLRMSYEEWSRTPRGVASIMAQGYDGIMVVDHGVMVFEPGQIKSALGNRGTFDPTNPDIMAAVRDPHLASFMSKIGSRKTPLRQRWQEFKSTIKDKINMGLFDHFHGIKRASNLAGVSMGDSGYMNARLSGNSAELVQAMMDYGHPIWKDGAPDIAGQQGIMAILKPLGPKLNDWLAYMVARRAERLQGEGRENLFTPQEIAAAKKLGQQNPEFEVVAKKYGEFQSKVLDFAEQAGIIDPDSRALWENQDYIPFYRLVENGEVQQKAGGGSGLGYVRNQIVKLKGGTSNLGDPLENIMRNWLALTDASLKAWGARAVVDGFDGTGLVTRVNTSGIPIAQGPAGKMVRVPQVVPAYNVAAFIAANPTLVQSLKAVGVDVRKLSPAQLRGLQTQMAVPAPAEEGTITVWRGGKRERWMIHDSMLFQSLQGINKKAWGPLMQIFTAPKRLVTATVTVTPQFAVKNTWRDMWHTFIIGTNDGKTITPVVDTIKGTIASMKMDETARSMLAGGASFSHGYIRAGDTAAGARAIRRSIKQQHKGATGVVLDSPMKLFRFYRKMLDASENANRVAIYNRALATGSTRLEALYEARDILDFSMRGNNPVVQIIADTVPFLNARLQGLYVLGRRSKKALALGFFMRGAILASATMALLARNWNDDRYKELTKDQKSNYWHIFDVFEKGDHWQIPKPFETGVIFGTIPEALADAMLTNADEPDAAAQAMDLIAYSFAQQLNMSPQPAAIWPMVELAINKNTYTGAPILNQGDQGILPEDQVGPNTSPTYRVIAQAMPEFAPEAIRSPKQLEHLARGYIGPVQDYVLLMTDKLVRTVKGEPQPAAATSGEIPGLRDFRKQGPSKHTKYMDAMYDIADQADMVAQSLKKATEAGTDEGDTRAEELLNENEALLSVRKDFDRAVKKVTALKKQQRAVQLDDAMTPDEKRIELDDIQQEINDIAKDVYELRPGSKLNPDTAGDLISATTPAQQQNVLRANGMPATADLAAQATALGR